MESSIQYDVQQCTVYCKVQCILKCKVQCTVKCVVHKIGGSEDIFQEIIGQPLFYSMTYRLGYSKAYSSV